MMVAVIVLAIIVSITIPRVARTAEREFDNAADRVADLLMMFAQRDNLGQRPVGLYHNHHSERQDWLMLMVLDDEGSGEPYWRRDPYVSAVKLPEVVDGATLTAYADGEIVGIRDLPCRLQHTPGEDRPTLELDFQSVDGLYRTTLILPPHAVAPRRVEEGDRVLSIRRQYDLDAAGRTREDW